MSQIVEDHGSEFNLPGGVEYVRAFSVPDRVAFIRDIPNRITRLRMRNAALSWSLSLSIASLKVLDDYVDGIIDGLLAQDKRIGEAIDRELVEDIVAYVGEVVVRSANGRWEEDASPSSRGPLLMYESSPGGEVIFRGLDIFDQVLVCLEEGGALSNWYQHEIN